jgi:hypothetical protein
VVTGLLVVSWAWAGFKVKAEALGPNADNAIAYGSSSDGRHCVTVEPENGKFRVYVDGKPGPSYDSISEARAFVSPDGKRWAVHFTHEKSGRFLVLDGKRVPGATWLAGSDGVTFSPDSRHYAYATLGSRLTVVRDGIKVADFDGDSCGVNGLWWSPDGAHFCFSIFRGGNFLDGKRLPGGSLTFSPDSKRRAYVTASGDEAFRVVTDSVPGPELRELVARPFFSPDGKHLAYAGRDSAGCHAYLDNTPGPAFDEVRELVFSGDGRTFGYLAQVSDTWKVVVNQEVKHFFADGSVPSLLQLDQSGANTAFLLENDGQYLVMHNAERGPDHDGQVERVVLSSDGSRVAYSVQAYVDFQYVGTVFVDGEANEDYSEIVSQTMQFSPDSKHYAYFADDASGLTVVLDGERVALCHSLATGGPYFHPDGTLEYLGTRDGTLYRMTHTPVK